MKENLSFSVDVSVKKAIIDHLKILNPQQLEFARVALGLKSKGELARVVSSSVSTLDAIYGVTERTVTIDRRMKIREKLDEALSAIGWELMENGGIQPKGERS